MHSSQKEVCRMVSEPDLHLTADLLTCEPAGLRQQEGAPGHEEEEGRLQQREAVQLGELGDVRVELKNANTPIWKSPFCVLISERVSEKKDMRAVTTPVAAPITKEPLKIPRKTPTDLKKAEASNMCVFAPAGW